MKQLMGILLEVPKQKSPHYSIQKKKKKAHTICISLVSDKNNFSNQRKKFIIRKREKKKYAYTYYIFYISSFLPRYGLLSREKCVSETICLRLLNTYDIILFDRKAHTIPSKKKKKEPRPIFNLNFIYISKKQMYTLL